MSSPATIVIGASFELRFLTYRANDLALSRRGPRFMPSFRRLSRTAAEGGTAEEARPRDRLRMRRARVRRPRGCDCGRVPLRHQERAWAAPLRRDRHGADSGPRRDTREGRGPAPGDETRPRALRAARGALSPRAGCRASASNGDPGWLVRHRCPAPRAGRRRATWVGRPGHRAGPKAG